MSIRGRLLSAASPAVLAGALAMVSACTVGPNYTRPNVTPPPVHRAVIAANQARSLAELEWFELFKDPPLDALVRQSLEQNFDLRLALLRVEEFRARGRLARADLGPSATGTFATGTSSTGRKLDNVYTLGLSLNWEVDLFGRLRRSTEAAVADLLATEENARGVMASLVADVAQTWFELRELDDEIVIVRRTIASQEASLELVRSQIRAGLASGAEEQQALGQLAATRAQLPSTEQQIVLRENALSVLIGRYPEGIARAGASVGPIAAVDIPVGLPAQLVERRPDIRAAERSLHAATARIGVAVANRFPYPTLSLTSFLGSISTALGDLLGGGDRGEGVASVGPNVNWPIWDSGRGRAAERIARWQAAQAEVDYRRTILLALREVADALITVQKSRELIVQQEVRVAAATEALRLGDLRYRAGVISYIEILDAQRQLFSAEIELARSRLTERSAVIQLYLALGGGWSDEELKKRAAAIAESE